jgi:exopolysaccharide biosynthesis predicted pyruvyltransferase EpsI
MTSGGCTDTVLALGETLRSVLDPLVEGESRFAIVGFPNHSNVGDAAIWLGQLAYLRRREGEVVYMCDEWSYDARELRRRLGDGTILLAGGGNLGDVWPDYQRLREQVVADFADNRIVQLPQTINFTDPANRARARRALSAHPRFTLLARDRPSLELARDGLDCTSELCPDMAFALGPLSGAAAPRPGVLALVRSDEESSGARGRFASTNLECADWSEPPRTTQALSRKLGALAGRYPTPFRHLIPSLYRLYGRMSKERLDAGTQLLTSRQAVVTDRLHGHILCVLLGVPHVCIDTGFGKISGFMDAWTGDCEIARLEGSADAAVGAVDDLLADLAGSRRSGSR